MPELYSPPSLKASIPIYACGRIVGKVIGDTFHKRVKASKHFLRLPQAICFDVQSLFDAREAGASFCEVFDIESERAYRASIHEVLQQGFSLDRGHGAQIALLLGKWTKSGGAGETVQLSLSFGG